MTTPLDIRAGDHVVISTTELASRLWQVEQCSPRGFLLRPKSGGDPQTWTHQEVFKVFAAGGLKLYPGPSRNADPRADALRTRAWDSYEPRRRREALRHLAYVKEAVRLIEAGEGQVEACKQAAETVYAANIEAWTAEERNAAIEARALETQKPSRKPVDPDAPLELPKDLEKHSWSSVRIWLKRWLNNGRDIRALIPIKHARGNRRSRHGLQAERLEILKQVFFKHYFVKNKCEKKLSLYNIYKEECKKAGIYRVEGYSSFCKRIKRVITEREEYAKKHGWQAALMKFGVFDERPLPDYALAEVQVDHCLIDVFVIPPGGGPPVRPWLTAIIDIATRMVLGIHIGFTPPSYGCLQRCIAHAIWPKDLSSFPEIENDWPAFGVFDLCLADNGLDFLCQSLREAEAALDFEVMNLPVFSPWLKGVVERLFRTFNTQVFDLVDGKARHERNALEPYNAARHATWTLDELSYEIVHFIVDVYHVTRHPRIDATPLARWRELTALKAVRIPPSADLIIALTGEVWRKRIGAKGVNLDGLTYNDRALFTEIRAERGGSEELWDFRRDPFDIGQIHFLYKGIWRHVPCTTPQAAVGVTRFQHRMHVAMAKHLAGDGNAVTEQHIVDAQALVAAQAQELKGEAAKSGPSRRLARYGDEGAYVTGLVGREQQSLADEERTAPSGRSAPDGFDDEALTTPTSARERLRQWQEQGKHG